MEIKDREGGRKGFNMLGEPIDNLDLRCFHNVLLIIEPSAKCSPTYPMLEIAAETLSSRNFVIYELIMLSFGAGLSYKSRVRGAWCKHMPY